MRRWAMQRPLTIAIPLLLLAACERQESPASPEPQSTPATPSPAPLDLGAVNERQDPARVLRFYAAALEAGDWQAASRAWGRGSGVSGITLQAEYGGKGRVILRPGMGKTDGAAGSLYYEAPVTLRIEGSTEERAGTITLRRANDVEGATPEQLRWHIEGSTIGPAR